MEINDINKMKILAGVPIVKGSTDIVKEESSQQNMVGRAINNYIKMLDNKMGVSKNREYISTSSAAASDFEDVLMMVRAGKQTKATKLFNELHYSYRENFWKSLRQDRVNKVKEYFNSLNEGCGMKHEDEEEEFKPFADEKEQSSEKSDEMPDDMLDAISDEMPDEKEEEPQEDNVECPYCDYTCPKIKFHDHIISKHVGDEEEDGVEGEKETVDVEPEFSLAAQDQQGSLVSNMGTIGLTFEDKQLKEAAVDATVWDKTDDKDESPNPYPQEDKSESTVKCPKNIKDALNKEIDELQKQAEIIIKSDYNTSEFYTNVANAMTEVLNYLSMESEYGMKMAQVCIQKYMSPIVQKFPAEVYDFVLRGGQNQSITALFKKSKDTNNATI